MASHLSEISVQYLKGVGPARMKILENLGVRTIEDLLYLFPRRYEDRRALTPVSSLKPGEWQTTSGVVLRKSTRKAFPVRKQVFELQLQGEGGRLACVWFNQPYLEKTFHEGERVVVHGKVDIFRDRLQMVCPEYEIISDDKDEAALSMGRIVPVYPLTRGITQRYLRRIIHEALGRHGASLGELLPSSVIERQRLMSLTSGIAELHFPRTSETLQAAERRVCFEEFFFFQICVMLRRAALVARPGIAHVVPAGFDERFEKSLSFSLTASQRKALAEMRADMLRPRPMLRLLQGDVGCGKTVVAFYGMLLSIVNAHQAAFLAPTEILARQQYHSFASLCLQKKFGKLRTALLTSELPKKERDSLLRALSRGDVDIVFGTHALLEDDVVFKDLSFVVIDEQHKFGVGQRARITAKGKEPDVLVMSATPIPRTLCLTLYGDLDISTITERPAGRGVVKTYHFTPEQADETYRKVAQWVAKGTQAFIVFPLIEESEDLDLKAAKGMYERLRKAEFASLRVGLVHGQMKKDEVARIMQDFREHALDVLVTTTVLEVGIDVANANVMVIENAERFGLSQLHQLRGRIGRGSKNAVCILLADARTPEAQMRLEAVVKTTDGFKIAEADLAIRGPGQYFGRHQHGINELKVVNPLTQMDVLEAARKEAAALVTADPALQKDPIIKQTIAKRYPEHLSRVLAG